jgi:Flp pilus assembly protein TadG
MNRRGTACVEFAVLVPILLLLFLGIVDVGQYVNVYQTVSNASREGARVAARQSTANVSDVTTAVSDYLTGTNANLPSSAVSVSVTNAGSAVTGTNLAAIAAGSPISVQVDVAFDSVRWLNGFTFLNGRTATTTTITRRE